MALKSVSHSPASLLGIPATSGPAGSHQAESVATAGGGGPGAAGQSRSADSSGSGGQSGPVGGFSFNQLLQAGPGAGAPAAAKTNDSAPPAVQDKAAGDEDTDSGSDPVAMALAMVSQSLAQSVAQAAGATTTPAAGGNAGATKSDAASAAGAAAIGALTNSADAAGTTGKTADSSATDGAATPASDSEAQGTQATAQSLFALLTQDGDAEPEAKLQAQLTQSDSSTTGPGADAGVDPGAAANAANTNAQLGVASHFSIQHTARDAQGAGLDVKSPVGSPAWADEVSGKITWMAHQGVDSASLKLSPGHLGPVEVRISVQDGGTSVWFGAAHADTRAALEQALPRLREMFSTQGLTLADAGVSREPPRQQQRPAAVQGISAIGGISSDSPGAPTSLSVRLGLLDTYA